MESSTYKSPNFDNFINKFIGFIFYYRLIFVALSVIGIILSAIYVYNISKPEDHSKNVAFVLTGGSIILGIFYSIINYEHNMSKFKYDVKNARDMLTFNTACKMCEKEIVSHSRVVREFYEKHEALFDRKDFKEIDKKFIECPDDRISYVILFNYFEIVAVGISHGLIDEEFCKLFLKSIFITNYRRFGAFVENNQTALGSRYLVAYIDLVKRWVKEN